MVGYIIGIDPGLSGGISILDISSKKLIVFPVPTHTEEFMKKGKMSKRKIYDLISIINAMTYPPSETEVFIEHVSARPGEGTVSSFRFGWGAGALEAIMHTKGYKVNLVRPVTWKKNLGLIGKDKNFSRELASDLFPKCSYKWKLKKMDGLAEATLLSWYGYKQKDQSVERGILVDFVC